MKNLKVTEEERTASSNRMSYYVIGDRGQETGTKYPLSLKKSKSVTHIAQFTFLTNHDYSHLVQVKMVREGNVKPSLHSS